MNKEQILKRLTDIQRIKKDVSLKDYSYLTTSALAHDYLSEYCNYKDGINVIIPTYKGEGVILQCLNSLYNQTLSKDLFDVFVIINGEKDATETIIENFILDTRLENITILSLDIASASLARNKGIENSRRKYTVFLDDDDYVSANFLKEMYRYSNFNTIVISQIIDVDENGNYNRNNSINKQIINLENEESLDICSLGMVSTINACKLVPTQYLKEIKYDPELKSGEDIVFFVELFIKNDLKYKIVPISEQVDYYRRLRNNSISRQRMTFDFNVSQRLQVISRLESLLNITYKDNFKTFIKQKIRAQFSFVNKYIKNNNAEKERIIKEIKKYNLAYIPYSTINKGLANKLIISYCFPPYMDTSGNVMAKRLRTMNDTVDVIYNKMDRVREKDNQLNRLVEDLIENRFKIPSYTSFSNWKAIDEFCNLGMSRIDGKQYKEIYSRAMWPGSHFLAYKYKINNPNTKWVAEFSDPILYNVDGNKRDANIEDKLFIKQAKKRINKELRLSCFESQKLKLLDDNNLFFWCEYLAYVFADELIFTNQNQMNFMIEAFPMKHIIEVIRRKAKVSVHPSLPKDFYYIEKSNYVMDKKKVNIGYFGNFYSTRNLDDIFIGLQNLDMNLKKFIKLHIFTTDPLSLQQELKDSCMDQFVKVNPYVSFTEFLNLTTIFDCLIVNDAKTNDNMSMNPYLPSKLSDYIGSGTKIWAIFEKGSVLSEYPLAYRSELGNIKEATDNFEKIVNSKIPKNF